MGSRQPLTPEQWEIARLFRQKLGLTYKQVGEVLGKSASMVKVGINGYEQYRTPSGGWSVRPRKGGGSAHTGPSPDQGGIER